MSPMGDTKRPIDGLERGEVHVWFAIPEEIRDAALLREYRALLDAVERRTVDRLRRGEDRHERLVSCALKRASLSRYADVPPGSWSFQRGPKGRPHIVSCCCRLPLHFNVSHTDGLVACAVTLDREVGLDVESTGRQRDLGSVANRFFSPEEARELSALPDRERRERFFDYWTLKEAYLKALGVGLSVSLAGFSFELADGLPIRVKPSGRAAEDPDAWQFELLRPTPDHVMAVAVRRVPGLDAPVRLWRTVPLS